MKKYIKIFSLIFITIICIILLDTILAVTLKNSPIISWKQQLEDNDSWVDKGIIIDTYYCTKEEDILTISWHFKTTKFTCPIDNVNNEETDNSNILKLNHRINQNELNANYARIEKEINIELIDFPKENINIKKYENEKYLDNIYNYVKDNINITLNDNWQFYIYYHDDKKTFGMIYFEYVIKDTIKTNKGITFIFEDNVINEVVLNCIESEVDEQALINRLNNFNNKYTQEKIVLKEGEEIIEERYNYIYYYGVDKFVYSYEMIYQKTNSFNHTHATTSYYIE